MISMFTFKMFINGLTDRLPQSVHIVDEHFVLALKDRSRTNRLSANLLEVDANADALAETIGCFFRYEFKRPQQTVHRFPPDKARSRSDRACGASGAHIVVCSGGG